MRPLLRNCLLLLPTLPLLPITLTAIYQELLTDFISDTDVQSPNTPLERCRGAHAYDRIYNDEVLNLGLQSLQNERPVLSDIPRTVVLNALRKRSLLTHPHKTDEPGTVAMINEPGSLLCYRAANDAVTAFCVGPDQWGDDYLRECKSYLVARDLEFADHYRKTMCEVAKAERWVHGRLEAATDAACDGAEWKVFMQEWRRISWEAFWVVLDPRFVWKQLVYDSMGFAVQQTPRPGKCFYEGHFHYFTSLVTLPPPTRTPSRMQWDAIGMVMVYCSTMYLILSYGLFRRPSRVAQRTTPAAARNTTGRTHEVAAEQPTRRVTRSSTRSSRSRSRSRQPSSPPRDEEVFVF